MKKTIFLTLIIITTITLAGCGKKSTNQNTITNQENQNLNSVISPNTNQLEDQTYLPPAQSGTVTITIKNFAFSPPTITIKDGTIIRWLNLDNASHQIVAEEQPTAYRLPSLASTILAPNQEWNYTFDGKAFFGEQWETTYNNQGAFGYYCKLHPSMKGTIVVTK